MEHNVHFKLSDKQKHVRTQPTARPLGKPPQGSGGGAWGPGGRGQLLRDAPGGQVAVAAPAALPQGRSPGPPARPHTAVGAAGRGQPRARGVEGGREIGNPGLAPPPAPPMRLCSQLPLHIAVGSEARGPLTG